MPEAKKEQTLEDSVNPAQTSAATVKTGIANKEAVNKEKGLETEAAKAPVDITNTSSQEYVDPITEEYLIERNCLIFTKWFLFYEVWPKKDKVMNMRCGVW